MRYVTTFAIAVLATGAVARADDEPADRARSAAESFLKALKSKDVAAAVRSTDLPFLFPDLKAEQPKLDRFERAGVVAAALKSLAEAKEGLPAAVGGVQSLAALKQAVAESPDGGDPVLKAVFEVGGTDGFLVPLIDDRKEQAGMLLVRVKGGAAKVVGILPVARPAPANQVRGDRAVRPAPGGPRLFNSV